VGLDGVVEPATGAGGTFHPASGIDQEAIAKVQAGVRAKPGLGGIGAQIVTPLEFIDRLAALVPPPRVHRHRYCGVPAPHTPLRAAVTTLGAPASARARCARCTSGPAGVEPE